MPHAEWKEGFCQHQTEYALSAKNFLSKLKQIHLNSMLSQNLPKCKKEKTNPESNVTFIRQSRSEWHLSVQTPHCTIQDSGTKPQLQDSGRWHAYISSPSVSFLIDIILYSGRLLFTKGRLHLLEIKLNFRNLTWSYWHLLWTMVRHSWREKSLKKHLRHFLAHPLQVVSSPSRSSGTSFYSKAVCSCLTLNTEEVF